MKIVHALNSLEMGGAEVLVGQLARLQRASGHEVSLCAYSKLGMIGESLQADGFEIYVPGIARPARTVWTYYRHFRKLRPDVVHCHNVAPTLQAALPARLAGVRRVIATRHSLVAPPYNQAEERKFGVMARCCDWIAGICEITCTNLRGAPLAQPAKIVRVYNGAEAIEPVEAEARPAGSFVLLFVGRLVGVKDLGTLLRAVALARQTVPHMQLWIVGGGDVMTELQELAAELQLGDGVRFWGQQMETARFYAAADVFTMSSVSEGLPMSLLQAMSVGLPAVVTDVGGMAEVVGSSESGLRTPVGDSRAMAAALVRMAAEPELRSVFAGNALKAYRRQFTLERMHEAYLEIYK